jgi:hypothetical protein
MLGTRVADLAPLRQASLYLTHSLPRAALKLPPGASLWSFSLPSD